MPKSEENEIEGNFDVAIQKGETVFAFEVKTTNLQRLDWLYSLYWLWQSSILYFIQYELDLDIELGSQALYGLFKSCHFSVTSPKQNGDAIIHWSGQASETNSRTTGKIAKDDAFVYDTMICLGTVNTDRCRKWAKTLKEDLSQYRTLGLNQLNPNFNLQRIDIEPIQMSLFE